MKEARTYDGLEIAVIGMSGQFPFSDDCNRYWDHLMAGKELTVTYSDDEIRRSGVSDEMIRDPRFVKSAAVLQGKEKFDHKFFGYRPDEAALMDPQIRLFHAHCWKALEDAGYSSDTGKQKIGLFAVSSENENWRNYAYQKAKELIVDPFYVQCISNNKFVSSLVAYKLNLKGPVLYLDSACSSSLVAIHTACKSLLTRECNIALSGGVRINSYIEKGYYYREGMILSSDGHCRTFDKSADGTYSGEGLGVVVLKRLNEAIRDRDHIYCIIKASAINNDGNNKVGFTAPSVQGQAECIRMAHRLGGVAPTSIGYVEAHGTATTLGDPIEIMALHKAFGVGGADKFCAIGSVKSNMGHLDTAAGVAGFIKASLCLKHKKIPASLHYTAPNPEIDFDEGPFYVNTRSKDWEARGDLPLRAGVSSFGIGGTNAHIVLEEAPVPEAADRGREYKLLLLSAMSQNSLKQYTEDLRSFIFDHPETDLAGMAYTSQVGRKHFNKRRLIVFKDRDDLLQQLGGAENKMPVFPDKEVGLAFMFPGQGSQYPGMGRDLYASEPVFRKEMDHGFTILQQLTGNDYKEILYPSALPSDAINRTLYAQPLIFLFEYALARLLMSWGIKPGYCIGHSIGEYVAACICGVFCVEDALGLVVKRAALMDSMPAGAMAVVLIPEEAARKYTNAAISLAAVNGPAQVVLSGPAPLIDDLMLSLKSEGIIAMKAQTSHAFHSSMLDPILDEFMRAFENLPFSAGRTGEIAYLSNRTGRFITENESNSPAYWVRHLRETVHFSAGIRTLLAEDRELLFVEAGAGRSLVGLLKEHAQSEKKPNGVNMIRHQNEKESDAKYMTEKIGQLWAQGAGIDWQAYNTGLLYRRVSYPTYSFEQTIYPAEVNPFSVTSNAGKPTETKKGGLHDWIYYPVWKSSFLFPPPGRHEKKCYLYFSMGDPFSEAFKRQLAKGDDVLIEVLMGDRWQMREKDVLVLNPVDQNHYKALFEELKRAGLVVTDLVYSWCMGAKPHSLALADDNKDMHLGYFCLVEIVRGLSRYLMPVKNGITILTESLQQVSGREEGSYVQSLILGLLTVIPQEYPVACRSIDIAGGDDHEVTAASLSAEICSDNFKDRIVAIRNGRRWIRDYQQEPAGPVNPAENARIKTGGVYLITGGLGNLGFLLAKHLIRRYHARIVLTGRREISGHPEDNEPARRLAYLEGLTKDVRYRKADVANAAELKELSRDIHRDLGRINGIIHTAGNIDRDCFELIEDITPENSIAVFLPKVLGIRNLYEIFKDADPDFVWISSSIASILGGLKFGSYAAANAFMEYFVSMHAHALPNWKCIGLAEIMATENENTNEAAKRQFLLPEEIIALFELSLEKTLPVIFETIRDLPSRLEETFVKDRAIDSAVVGTIEMSERPALADVFVAPFSKSERTLVDLMEHFFGIAGLGINDNFFDLGGDSLMAMSFLTKVRNAFDINITIKFFFDNPTVKAISSKLNEITLLKDVKKHNSKKII